MQVLCPALQGPRNLTKVVREWIRTVMLKQ